MQSKFNIVNFLLMSINRKVVLKIFYRFFFVIGTTSAMVIYLVMLFKICI